MSFRSGLNNLLVSSTGLQAVLGTASTRADKKTGIFPILADTEAQLPYIVYQQVTGDPVQSYDGTNKLAFCSFRFRCYAARQLAAIAVADALKLLMTNAESTLNDGTKLEQISQTLEADDIEESAAGRIFAVHVDYSFCYLIP